MVISIILAITSAPALLGTQEAIRQSQAKEKREEHRARRCNLVVSSRCQEVAGRLVVLRDGRTYVDVGASDKASCHPFAGYYLPYPDSSYEGLVTTITEEAPILNWVYVDASTHAICYGVREDAQPNLTGPWNCTRQDRRMTFEGWEGFVAVQEDNGEWGVYFDRDDDGMRKVLDWTERRVVEIELVRIEKRWKKDASERQKDQTTIHTAEEDSEAERSKSQENRH